MKTSLMRRVMALVVAVLMLVPMAAQADSLSGYGEIELSNVVVNYMGTELDFSGLSLRLLGGIDADDKNAILGLTATMPDASNASVAFELGEKEATVLLLDQLMTIPYDRFDEAMAKMGVETDGSFKAEDVAAMWKELAALDVSNMDDDLVEDLMESLKGVEMNQLEQYIEAELENAVPEDAEFELGGKTCKGQKVTLTIASEKATELMTAGVKQIYGDEGVRAALTPVFDALDKAAVASGETEVKFSEMYDVVVDSLAKIKIPTDMNVTVYVDEESGLGKVVIDRFTVDMADYINEIVTKMGDGVEVDSSEVTSIDMDMAIGLYDVEGDDSDIEVNCYMTGSDAAFMNMSAALTGTDDEGALTLAMTVDPQAMGERDEAVAVNVDCTWSDDDDATANTFYMTASEGGNQVMSIDFDSASQTAGDTTNGTASLSISSEGQLIPMFDAAYTLTDKGEDACDVSFDVTLMGMVNISGDASLMADDMDAQKLMSTSGAQALNLADATDEDMQTMMVGLQNSAMQLIMSVQQVPGIAALMGAAGADSAGVTAG